MKLQNTLSSSTEQKAVNRQTYPAPASRSASLLVSKLRERMPVILEEEPVQLAYLYGSIAAGQTTPFSDFDVALVVGDAIDALKRLKLILPVQLALAGQCDIENAEVRVIDDAPLVFRGRVVSDGVLLYARDHGERITFETTTRMQYLNYSPMHQELQMNFFEDIRQKGLYG